MQLFKKHRSDNLSKIDYWKKWSLFELFDELHKAEQLLLDLTSKQTEGELVKFKNDYVEELFEMKGANVADFTRLWEWFTPGKEWDILVGEKSIELGDNIFRIIDEWKRNQDFLKGTKVSLQNEFGVVLDKTADNDNYGLIRWDTDKENDVEDWRGLFGSFLQAGGQIINQDHKFKFLNDDGSRRTPAADNPFANGRDDLD